MLAVYLIRIRNIPCGFTTVAVVAASPDAAKSICVSKGRCQFDDVTSPDYATIEGVCDATDGELCSFEFEE